jgi:hypothetical protein
MGTGVAMLVAYRPPFAIAALRMPYTARERRCASKADAMRATCTIPCRQAWQPDGHRWRGAFWIEDSMNSETLEAAARDSRSAGCREDMFELAMTLADTRMVAAKKEYYATVLHDRRK